MNFYLSAVDDMLRHASDQPTIGLILCKGKNQILVETSAIAKAELSANPARAQAGSTLRSTTARIRFSGEFRYPEARDYPECGRIKAMNGKLMNLAERLQTMLESLDSQKDRDTLIWAHGFLTAIAKRIESGVPGLVTTKTLLQQTQSNLDHLERRRLADTSDSLDLIERDLDDLGDAPVPAKRNPRPTGQSGGAALPLPESELPM